MSNSNEIGEQLLNFYREWNRKIQIVRDRNLSFKERLAALRWIDANCGGEDPPADELEDIANRLDEVM